MKGSLFDQINKIRKNATVAVGWNSGGLDLASAAGLPVLRIGEFQDGGPSCENDRLRKRYNWGKFYNSFLACATNIGLAPKMIAADTFPKEVIEDSLDSLLANMKKNPASLAEERHIILPPGKRLPSDNLSFDDCLKTYTVPWPF
jgi:hypothetical protein